MRSNRRSKNDSFLSQRNYEKDEENVYKFAGFSILMIPKRRIQLAIIKKVSNNRRKLIK